MMEMTTNNSINVKADLCFMTQSFGFIPLSIHD